MQKSLFCAALLVCVPVAWSQTLNEERDVFAGDFAAPVMYYSEDPIPNDAPETSHTDSAGRDAAFRTAGAVENPAQATSNPVPPPQVIRTRRIAGSSTGYIDNAIIESEIRFRFDGDFSLQQPDRAEFFYAKCGCYRPSPDPNAPGPGTVVAASANLQELQLHLEYAAKKRLSFFAELPERSIQFTPVGAGSIPSASGFGDFRAGFKFALLAAENRYVTFQMRAYFPTGDSFRGLGTSHYSVEPTLLYYQRFAERWTLAAQFGDWHPIGGSSSLGLSPPNPNIGFAGDVLEYGAGVSYDLVSGSTFRFTPVLEFVGWSVLSGLVTTPADGTGKANANIVNVKIGARLGIGAHNSVYLGYGHALTNATWYQNLIRLEYRFVF